MNPKYFIQGIVSGYFLLFGISFIYQDYLYFGLFVLAFGLAATILMFISIYLDLKKSTTQENLKTVRLTSIGIIIGTVITYFSIYNMNIITANLFSFMFILTAIGFLWDSIIKLFKK